MTITVKFSFQILTNLFQGYHTVFLSMNDASSCFPLLNETNVLAKHYSKEARTKDFP